MEHRQAPFSTRAEERPGSSATLTTPAALQTEPLKIDGIAVFPLYEASRWYALSKRLLDIILSLLGLMVLLPVLLLIALYIKWDDGGPVLHFREIIGMHGKRFYALKFRTMITDADAYLAKHPELLQKYRQNIKLERDPRITSAGKFLRRYLETRSFLVDLLILVKTLKVFIVHTGA